MKGGLIPPAVADRVIAGSARARTYGDPEVIGRYVVAEMVDGELRLTAELNEKGIGFLEKSRLRGVGFSPSPRANQVAETAPEVRAEERPASGLYDGLTPEMLVAGPRRVAADGVVHERPPAHVPRLATDETPETAGEIEAALPAMPAAWWPRVE